MSGEAGIVKRYCEKMDVPYRGYLIRAWAQQGHGDLGYYGVARYATAGQAKDPYAWESLGHGTVQCFAFPDDAAEWALNDAKQKINQELARIADELI